AGQSLVGFAVLCRGALDHIGRQLWPRSFFVPVERFEMIAHELFVEGWWADAFAVAVGRPEARGIRCQSLVDEVQRAGRINAELELGVGDDDAAFTCVGGRFGV